MSGVSERGGDRPVDLSDDKYVVKRAIGRSRWRVENSEGRELVRSERKWLDLGTSGNWETPEGEPVFGLRLDSDDGRVARYVLAEFPSGEPIAILERQFSYLVHEWKIRHPETDDVEATVTSRGSGAMLVRSIPVVRFFARIVPVKYTVEASDGTLLGTVTSRPSLGDTYTITIHRTGDIPRRR